MIRDSILHSILRYITVNGGSHGRIPAKAHKYYTKILARRKSEILQALHTTCCRRFLNVGTGRDNNADPELSPDGKTMHFAAGLC